MDASYAQITLLIVVFSALGAALVWSIGHGIYLNRIGSRGWASTRRLLIKAGLVFILALPAAFLIREWDTVRLLVEARLGKAEAQFQLARCYQRGEGLTGHRLDLARAWYLKAAEQQHVEAQLSLVRLYFFGEGGPRDFSAAQRWAKPLADRQNVDAVLLMGESLEAQSAPEAQAYFVKALPLLQPLADQRNTQACINLAGLYWNGRGLPKDPVEAWKWLLLGAKPNMDPFHRLAFDQYQKALSPAQQSEGRSRAEAWLKARTPHPATGS
ncbi:MAG TPA: tetratricopeptide repeat protein [Holophagaceae bacterium]|nr:tetratricopeptide repeat protein [Holophagaceae bacterium]